MTKYRITVKANVVKIDRQHGSTWQKESEYKLDQTTRSLLSLFLKKFGQEAPIRGKSSRRWFVDFDDKILKVAIAQLQDNAKTFLRLTILSDTPEAFAAAMALA